MPFIPLISKDELFISVIYITPDTDATIEIFCFPF
jgi:hypothetical protein